MTERQSCFTMSAKVGSCHCYNTFSFFSASDDADCARVVQTTGTESNRF